jgi:hypothetical protein
MNVYKTLINLLNSAPTFNFEDKVVKTAVRIAQNGGDTRINGEVLELIAALHQENAALHRENALYKQNNLKLNVQIQQLTGNMANMEGNQIPDDLNINESTITPGGIVVTPKEVNKPVTLRNENYQPSSVVTVGPMGIQQNSPTNIQ